MKIALLHMSPLREVVHEALHFIEALDTLDMELAHRLYKGERRVRHRYAERFGYGKPCELNIWPNSSL